MYSWTIWSCVFWICICFVQCGVHLTFIRVHINHYTYRSNFESTNLNKNIALIDKQEKVKHIITCFTKALLHVFKCICTGFCSFLTTLFWPACIFALMKNRSVAWYASSASGTEIHPRVLYILSLKSFTLSCRFCVTGDGISNKYWLTASVMPAQCS